MHETADYWCPDTRAASGTVTVGGPPSHWFKIVPNQRFPRHSEKGPFLAFPMRDGCLDKWSLVGRGLRAEVCATVCATAGCKRDTPTFVGVSHRPLARLGSTDEIRLGPLPDTIRHGTIPINAVLGTLLFETAFWSGKVRTQPPSG